MDIWIGFICAVGIPVLYMLVARRWYRLVQARIDSELRELYPPHIAKAIRDEINQTPEWWDREFRRLTRETFRPKPFDITEHEGHEIAEESTFTNPHAFQYCLECSTEYEPRWGEALERRIEEAAFLNRGEYVIPGKAVMKWSPGGLVK